MYQKKMIAHLSFIIDIKRSNFLTDFKAYLKQKHTASLIRLLYVLTVSVLFHFLILNFTDWKTLELFSFISIIFIANFILFKIYDLIKIEPRLKKISDQGIFGKINVILEPTQIKIIKGPRQRVIFLSQLIECRVISNTLFFIEKKNKNLPFKVNMNEVDRDSFQLLKESLIDKGVKIR